MMDRKSSRKRHSKFRKDVIKNRQKNQAVILGRKTKSHEGCKENRLAVNVRVNR